MMLAYRLVRLIEQHYDRLAEGLLNRIKNCDKTNQFYKVPPEDFRSAVTDIYRHLGEWLIGKGEHDIARRYTEIGSRRAFQKVPLSQLIYAITLTREHLWEYLTQEDRIDQPVEIFGELEMLQLLEQFFDRATYYAAVGYEQALARMQEPVARHKASVAD